MDINERGQDTVDCINIAQEMDQWQALVNIVNSLLIA